MRYHLLDGNVLEIGPSKPNQDDIKKVVDWLRGDKLMFLYEPNMILRPQAIAYISYN